MTLSTAENITPELLALEGSHEDAQRLLNANIVIVDDEATTMDVVQAFLEETGYRNFVLIEDSSEAMAILDQNRPDLLLLDLMMPRLSGFDLLKEVRSHPKLKHLPVIILTSSSDNADKLRALDLGATDFLAKPVDPSELRLRVRNTLAAKAYMDQLVFCNPRTNLPNRHMLMEYLEQGLASAKSNNDNLALLSVEVDQFEKISNTLGLIAGDDILEQLTRRLKTAVKGFDVLRHFDNDEHVLVNLFHLEGGMFNLLLNRIPNVRDAAMVAECLLESIREVFSVQNTEIYLTASIGIATYPMEDVDSFSLVQLASSARDYVKNNGGDAFQFSSRQINTQHRRRLGIESRLRKALEREELLLYYQPKVDVRSNQIMGVEALLRWQANDTTLVPLHKFIPIAEETGLMHPIGEWVLSRACNQLAAWQEAGKAPIGMAVNLSPVQLQREDWPAKFSKIVVDSGISPNLLTLEVTENMLLDDVDSKIESMNRLREMGIKMAIDDFGTGYSSLSYLKKLPLDELKIDRSFFINLFADTKSSALVTMLIYLSRSFNLLTVAEGVETQQQLNFLKKIGCHQYQGFLFSRPVKPETLFEMLTPVKGASANGHGVQ